MTESVYSQSELTVPSTQELIPRLNTNYQPRHFHQSPYNPALDTNTPQSIYVDYTKPNNEEDNLYQNTIRVVSEKECIVMKKNVIFLLKENQTDEQKQFHWIDFVDIFQRILPNSPEAEVKKLFMILDGENMKHEDISAKTISFDEILNNSSNFSKLLKSMGCITEQEHDLKTPANYVSDTMEDSDDTDYEEDDDARTPSLTVNAQNGGLVDTPRSSSADTLFEDEEIEKLPTANLPNAIVMPSVNENQPLLPQLSWKQQIYVPGTPTWRRESPKYNNTLFGAGQSLDVMGKSCKNVNGQNYNEYIVYQKEQIVELRNKVKELNRFEIKCNELQMDLDTKNEQIMHQNEEIAQLNRDKQEYMMEVQRIQKEYESLSQQIQEFHQYKQIQQIQQESQHFVAQELEQLKNNLRNHQQDSIKLKEETEALNTLNSQFTQINQKLRDELEKEKNKMMTLKERLNTKDEEIKTMKLDSLHKDQFIQSIQNANEDLTNQLNLYLYSNSPRLTSSRFSTRENRSHSDVDWRYAPSPIMSDTQRQESHCLEFDIFEDLTTPRQDLMLNPILGGSSSSCRFPKTPTPKNLSTNSILHQWHPYGGVYNQSLPNFSVIFSEEAENQETQRLIEDEKYHEEYQRNHALLGKIKRLETELEHFRTTDKQREGRQRSKTRKRTTSTQFGERRNIRVRSKRVGFWQRILAQIQCVPHDFNKQ